MESCIFCVQKHLGMADGYLQEAGAGYAGRFAKALGQLALAEEEAGDWPVLQQDIRVLRKDLETTGQSGSNLLNPLLVQAEYLAAEADLTERKVSPLDHDQVIDPPLEEGDCPPECQKRRHKAAIKRAQRAGRGHAQLIAQQEPQGPQTIRRPIEAGPIGLWGEVIHQEAPKPILVLMTALASFSSGYSLTTVIKDQAKAGVLAGYDVHLVTMEQTSQNRPTIPGVTIDTIIPNVIWKEDEVDDSKVDQIRVAIDTYINGFYAPNDANPRPMVIITHDFLLQTWYICAAKALHLIGDRFDQYGMPVRWFHQIHSSVGKRPTAPGTNWRCSIPKTHRVMLVNWSDLTFLQEYYQAGPESFHTMPNIRDPEDFWGFSEQAANIAQATKMVEADIVQVYPVSTPRAQAKGVDRVLHLFGILKRDFGKKVCLVMANAHANGNQAVIQNLKSMAKGAGLEEEEFHVTSEIVGGSGANGLPMTDISALMSLSNIFCFPSVSEACGLVMLEAALAGCLLVLNNDLPTLKDFIQPEDAIWAAWGSLRQGRQGQQKTPEGYWQEVAKAIIEALQKPPNLAKRRVLRQGTAYLAKELAALRKI